VVPPAELSRRLAQIGVVNRKDGPRLARELKPGQRLVSREGDLWRWDGFAAAANAQTPAARRLAQRNRFGDLERDVAAARAEVGGKRDGGGGGQAGRGGGPRQEAEGAAPPARGAGGGGSSAGSPCGGGTRREPHHRPALGPRRGENSPDREP